MKEQPKAIHLDRHDLSTDRSLRPYSAADEYLLKSFIDENVDTKNLAIYHDRFGFLSCHLSAFNPLVIFTNKSQLNAIELNCKANQLPFPQVSDPLSLLAEKIDFALMKAPKSLALFQLYLEHIAQNSGSEVTVNVAFMTRHFSTKLLQIAQHYFEKVEQSKAVKKARVMHLSGKKEHSKINLLDELEYNNDTYRQYWGVFSAKHIDYATQYFLAHLELKSTDHTVLDLASGNGVIGKEILKRLPNVAMHLMDDAYLAVESAKLNVKGENVYHHFNRDLSDFDDQTFDLIVTNPPFHFEYEINIQIPIQLFRECFRCLKTGGSLQIVANRHLNYQTHLTAIFPSVQVLAQNDNFIVYKCLRT